MKWSFARLNAIASIILCLPGVSVYATVYCFVYVCYLFFVVCNFVIKSIWLLIILKRSLTKIEHLVTFIIFTVAKIISAQSAHYLESDTVNIEITIIFETQSLFKYLPGIFNIFRYSHGKYPFS